MSRSPKLPPGEHRSPRRRASWRAYYVRNAPKVRKRSAAYYAAHREHCLLKKRAYRRKQHRSAVYGSRPVSEREWQDIRDFYQAMRAQGNSITFRELAARFKISPRRILRRSGREGGWALRADGRAS